MSNSSSSSLDDLLPLILLSRRHDDLLPLLLLLGRRPFSESSSSESPSEETGTPTSVTFPGYLAGLVGDIVRLTVAPPFGPVVVGRLVEVGTDFIILRDVQANGVFIPGRFAMPIGAIVSIVRIPFIEGILPFLLRRRHSSS